MQIKYLKNLEENKTDGHGWTCKPINLAEIANLEATFNSGNPFPAALKELLFLAGDFCPYLDFGLADSQQELQDEARDDLNFYNLTISRPFMTIMYYVPSGDYFHMVYLDEGIEDPPVYQVFLTDDGVQIPAPQIDKFQSSLSEYIDIRIYSSKIRHGQL